jgi:hypothetical protein
MKQKNGDKQAIRDLKKTNKELRTRIEEMRESEIFAEVIGQTLFIWGTFEQTVNVKRYMDRGGIVAFYDPDNPPKESGTITIAGGITFGGTVTLEPATVQMVQAKKE